MWWVVNATPRPLYPPGKTPVTYWAGGTQGRSGQVRKFSPFTGIRSPDRPTRSQSLYPRSLWGTHRNVEQYSDVPRATMATLWTIDYVGEKPPHAHYWHYTWRYIVTEVGTPCSHVGAVSAHNTDGASVCADRAENQSLCLNICITHSAIKYFDNFTAKRAFLVILYRTYRLARKPSQRNLPNAPPPPYLRIGATNCSKSKYICYKNTFFMGLFAKLLLLLLLIFNCNLVDIRWK
jgi:hypothetical protein